MPVTIRSCSSRRSDAGFSLIEMVMVMSVAGVLSSIALFGFSNWRTTAQQQGSAQQMVSQFRNAAELALSEGRTHCIDMNAAARTFSVWRYECSASGTQVSGTLKTQSSKVTFTPTLTIPSPAPPCPSGDSCLYFYPRGTAIPATITVQSTQRSKVYTIHVEGLTARVYM
jgi:prepilin-type N-terminal cleavage/methylation domain-containing protein